jgi:hypothetical protein
MGETGDDYKAMNEHGKEKRSNNRDKSAEYLNEHSIPFETKNFGVHLIVEGRDCYIDFWPGTGKWKTRKGESGFGVRNLADYILK